jgi:hypothetical protein
LEASLFAIICAPAKLLLRRRNRFCAWAKPLLRAAKLLLGQQLLE